MRLTFLQCIDECLSKVDEPQMFTVITLQNYLLYDYSSTNQLCNAIDTQLASTYCST